MDFNQIWPLLVKIFDAALVPIVGALGVWGIAQVKRWQAKTDLKTMMENSKAAVNAVDKLYPDLPGSEKKKIAISWANHLNTVAGLPDTTPTPTPITPAETQVILNEGNVNQLPPKEEPIDMVPKG